MIKIGRSYIYNAKRKWKQNYQGKLCKILSIETKKETIYENDTNITVRVYNVLFKSIYGDEESSVVYSDELEDDNVRQDYIAYQAKNLPYVSLKKEHL